MPDKPESRKREITAHTFNFENKEDAAREMSRMGVHHTGIDIMAPKAVFRVIKIYDIAPYHANILKQEMLSIGAEAATAQGCIDGRCERTDVLLMGTLKHFYRLFEKLSRQPDSFRPIAEAVDRALKSTASPGKLTWKTLNHFFTIKTGHPLIMGIINVTPDSFSDGGRYLSQENAIEHALKLERDGADILDIGGESTRPGSKPAPEEVELERVIPVIQSIREKSNIPISIDTRKSGVALRAIESGATIVNDVSALRDDPKMAEICSDKDVGVILMHMKGNPRTMQKSPHYEDVIQEISDFFEERIRFAGKKGIDSDAICLDPGIGFGKRLQDNLDLCKAGSVFTGRFGRPVLIGPSRKRFIGELTGKETGEREYGTIGAIMAAIRNGASIVRVHNVAACSDAIMVMNEIENR